MGYLLFPNKLCFLKNKKTNSLKISTKNDSKAVGKDNIYKISFLKTVRQGIPGVPGCQKALHFRINHCKSMPTPGNFSTHPHASKIFLLCVLGHFAFLVGGRATRNTFREFQMFVEFKTFLLPSYPPPLHTPTLSPGSMVSLARGELRPLADWR